MNTRTASPDLGAMIAFEEGELDTGETLALFASLVRSGLAWSLQGFYGRTAAALIDGDYLTPDGEITDLGRDVATFEDHQDDAPFTGEDWES